MYCGGAIFIDQASGYIHVEFQTTLTPHATLRAKDACEQHYSVVIPQKYLSDNGTAFTSQDYWNHLKPQPDPMCCRYWCRSPQFLC